ncbi:hypothetical protein GAMM_90021 [Gammaproteobacteria bacterium]
MFIHNSINKLNIKKRKNIVFCFKSKISEESGEKFEEYDPTQEDFEEMEKIFKYELANTKAIDHMQEVSESIARELGEYYRETEGIAAIEARERLKESKIIFYG